LCRWLLGRDCGGNVPGSLIATEKLLDKANDQFLGAHTIVIRE
jgi:hypothetical protein